MFFHVCPKTVTCTAAICLSPLGTMALGKSECPNTSLQVGGGGWASAFAFFLPRSRTSQAGAGDGDGSTAQHRALRTICLSCSSRDTGNSWTTRETFGIGVWRGLVIEGRSYGSRWKHLPPQNLKVILQMIILPPHILLEGPRTSWTENNH